MNFKVTGEENKEEGLVEELQKTLSEVNKMLSLTKKYIEDDINKYPTLKNELLHINDEIKGILNEDTIYDLAIPSFSKERLEWDLLLNRIWKDFTRDYQSLYELQGKLTNDLGREYVRKLILVYRALSDLVNHDDQYEELTQEKFELDLERYMDMVLNLITFEDMVSYLDLGAVSEVRGDFKLPITFKAQYNEVKNKYRNYLCMFK
ncbi:hypothetical protein ACU3L3_14195 [Priestia endophytica]